MLNVASIQMDCVPGDVKQNLNKAVGFIHEAKEQGAELILLPELFNVGYDFTVYETMDYSFEQTKEVLADTAKQLNIHLVAGVLELVEDKYHNSVLVFDNFGQVIARYSKVNLFPLSYEEEIFVPGAEAVTVKIGEIQFGIMICFDLRFPELSRQYLKEECDAILIASAFPFPRLDHWRTLLKARAIENQMYVVSANRSGQDGGLTFLGNSCIIDPWGTVKATASETEEGIITHTIDPEKVQQVRQIMPVVANFKRLNELF